METTTNQISNEALKVGDTIVAIGGFYRIISIEQYVGPLSDIVFAIARLDRGVGISLVRGGSFEVVA